MNKKFLMIIVVILFLSISTSYTGARYKFDVSKSTQITSDKMYNSSDVSYDKYVKEDDQSLIINLVLNNYVSSNETDLDTVFEVSIDSSVFGLVVDDKISDDNKMNITIAGGAKTTKNYTLKLALREGALFNEQESIGLSVKTISPYTKDVLNKTITVVSEENLAEHIILKRMVWQSGLTNDGYRYTGLSPDNYVCFGTDNKSDCINNPDRYMYRIIGVFKDSNSVNHVKLIKYKQLKNKSLWYATNSTASWDVSLIRTNVNGPHFLTNTSSYPYLSTNTSWYSSITDWNYAVVMGYSSTFEAAYKKELSSSTSSSKIGLMYDSDIGLSLGSVGIKTTAWRNKSYPLLKSWLHQSNNDTSVDTDEWTISVYCNGCSHYYANGIKSTGTLDAFRYSVNSHTSRPVFYLDNGVKYLSGTGTLDNPYIIGVS